MSLDITNKIHIRFFLACPIIFVLVLFGDLIFNRLNAEIFYYSAEQESGISKLNSAEQSVKLAPLNYKYRVQMARINYRLSRPLHSAQDYKNAVNLRPTWPLAWLHLFKWESGQNKNSEKLDYLISKSHQYGQFHMGLNNQLAKLVLRKEKIKLSESSILIINNVLSRQLKVNPLPILSLAYKLEKENMVCGPYALDDYAQYLCQRMLKAANRCENHLAYNLSMKQCRDKYH